MPPAPVRSARVDPAATERSGVDCCACVCFGDRNRAGVGQCREAKGHDAWGRRGERRRHFVRRAILSAPGAGARRGQRGATREKRSVRSARYDPSAATA